MKDKKSGFIIINKPVDFTSHDVIAVLRGITGIKKIGHAGTLDPFATGVLICALHREATKKINQFVKLDKEYEATLRLGATTDTYDRTGVKSHPPARFAARRAGEAGKSVKSKVQLKDVKSVLEKFIGKQKQLVPAYSATKIGGKKMYELARAGQKITLPPTEIEIYDIELLNYEYPNLAIKVNCSTGTYIRSLGHDIGQKLKCGAYLEELKRTAVGEFKLSDAVELDKLNKRNWGKYIIS